MNNRTKLIIILILILAVSYASSILAYESISIKKTIQFAVIGDRTGSAQEGIYEQVVKKIESLKPDFVVTVGDMIEGPTTDSANYISKWDEYFEIVSEFSRPLYYTTGNNDIYSDFEEKMYQQVVGDPYYSINVEDVHIVMIDNGRWGSSVELIENDPEQYAWLVDDLNNHKHFRYTLVFYHRPNWYTTIADNKPDTLHNLFINYGIDAVFNGHFHNYFSGEFDGIKYTTIGSSGGGFNPDPTGLGYHFAWVTIDDEGIHITPITMDGVLDWDHVTAKDKRTFTSINLMGLKCPNPLTLDSKGVISKDSIEIMIDNTLSKYDISDTLYWEVPDGWTITPPQIPINVASGLPFKVSFKTECNGNYFPTPEAKLKFNYAKDKKVEASTHLKVSQYAVCNKRNGKFKLDGIIDEKFWIEPIEKLHSWDGSPMEVEPVKYYFSYDKKNLYIAVRCEDSKIDSLVANATGEDVPVYGEDCVGFFIEPNYKSDTVYQIYFNQLGATYDAQWWPGTDGYRQGGMEWDGEYKVATAKGDDYWSIEIQIPLKQFGAKIKAGEKMRVNLRRKHKRLNAAADWQVPLEYDASTYGHLNFVK